MEVVQQLVQSIRSFERPQDGASLTSIQQANNRDIVERIHGVLDFRGLAERSLGATWEGLKPAQRSAFVDLLKSLFAEVAYPNSAQFFGELKLEFSEGGERKGQQVVEVAVSHPDEGLIDLEFFLGQVEGAWKVQDLSLDGVSMGRDIKAQMQKIIKDEGYPKLLERMRDKLAEEGVKAPAPSD